MLRKSVESANEILDKYFPVLDNGFVALVDYMGSDESIERYARVSYGSGTRKTSDSRNLIRYLINHHHSTPLESVELAFHISLPIHVARQLVRHRTFSPINEYSARYSVMPDIQYTPKIEQFGMQSKNNKQGRDDTLLNQEDYNECIEEINQVREKAKEVYYKLLDKGVAREVARMDLPLSYYTYWYCKMDLNNLMRLLNLRCDGHAQWEIRQYANKIAGMFKRVAPIAFEAWEDYIFYASNWTRLDKQLLVYLASRYGDSNYDSDIYNLKQCYDNESKYETAYHKTIGMSSRELDDFWTKLNIPDKKDFNLDLNEAKEPSFYEKLMKDNSRD